MGGAVSIALRKAEYAVLEVALPDIPVENAGVLLLDPQTNQLWVRMRRDWEEFAADEDLAWLREIEYDLQSKSSEFGAAELLQWLEDRLSNTVRISDRMTTSVHSFESALGKLYQQYVLPKVLPFRTHLPLYSARAAAGKFGERMEVEEEGWLEAPADLRLDDRMFVAHVTGRSMEPRIPDGSLCVFREFGAGSRQGKLVLVMNYGEPGENRFTIKRYRSVKQETEEGWMHDRIVLEPLNPEYDSWDVDEHSDVKVLAEFVRALD